MLKRIRLFLAAGSFVLFFCASAHAADNGVYPEVSVDRATASIGDRVKLTVTVEYHPKVQIDYPEFKDGKMGDFDIKDFGSDNRQQLIGGMQMRHWYYIAAYSVGKKEIPPIKIKYSWKGAAEWKSVETHALHISIVSVLPKAMPTDIKDVKGPMSYFEVNWALVSGIFLVMLMVAGVIMLVFRKKPGPVKLAHEMAFEELEAARSNFLKSSDLKEYYTGISGSIRHYIERAFKLKAPEMTTEEFLGSLGGSTALPPDQKDLLKAFLNACDLVKFAKYTPARSEMDSVLVAAKKFIDETKEAFLPKPGNGRRV